MSRFFKTMLVPFIFTVVAKGADNLNLRRLDDILTNRHAYEQTRRDEINDIWVQYKTATTDSDRYNVLRALYKEYRTFRIDSAVIIAAERLDIARRMQSKSKIASASLNLAEGYVKSGLADKALAILDTLDMENLETYHRKYLNSVYKNAYKLKAEMELLPAEKMKYKEKVKVYREKALEDNGFGSRGYYTTLAEKYMDAGMYEEAVIKIEEADRLFDFSNDASMQYVMGEIYLAAGRREKAIESLSRASAIDISSGVKEYQSLILLASILLEEGDVERAFVYINNALEDIHFSNASVRNPAIMESMPLIDKAFHAYEIQKRKLTRTFLWIAGVLVLLLAASVVLLLRSIKINRRMLVRIREINRELTDRNKRLEEADNLKISNINTLILSNARYISRLKEYRQTVYRLMKTGQYDKAMETLKSGGNTAKDINAFHEMFDESFLSMFPDFIESVNSLLKTPVELKDKNRLTPELRVIALMRLGLRTTEEIAGVLHYTSQTVYNLRSTVRSMSKLPKEEFEEAVKKL